MGWYLEGVVIVGEEERCAKTYAQKHFTITSKSILSIRSKLTLYRSGASMVTRIRKVISACQYLVDEMIKMAYPMYCVLWNK